MNLDDWLAHCERLHPVAIDMGLARVQEVAERLALKFDAPVITVAGTNGKGSTCAMLEAILLQAGYRTGVYTSPHLVHFEERCRLSGQAASAQALAEAFAAVEAARGEVSLTYFEFSTLAILWLMSRENLDAVILEVGLGGRLDAVNVVDADCAVITSIDLDHTAILGPDRESIGREKAGIMRTGRPVVVSDPVPPQSVLDQAEALGADLWRFGRDFNFSGDKQQWSWAGRGRRYSGMAYPALRGANQLMNASGALAALESLRARIPVTAQAVRKPVKEPGPRPNTMACSCGKPTPACASMSMAVGIRVAEECAPPASVRTSLRPFADKPTDSTSVLVSKASQALPVIDRLPSAQPAWLPARPAKCRPSPAPARPAGSSALARPAGPRPTGPTARAPGP